jgi:hypothetical protein
MIELSQLTVLIMIEVIIGLAIVCGVLGFFALRRKGKIRQAAHHLAERVQNDKAARSQRLKSLLSDQYGLSGNELEQRLHNIMQAEMKLFQNLINGYIKDDQVHLQQIDVDEENLVLAYQGLKPVGGATAAVTTDSGDAEEEVQRLRDENQRLSDELKVTMDTMGRMLNEYSSMFAGGEDKPLTREDATEVLEAPVNRVVASASSAIEMEDDMEVDIPDFQAEDVAVEPMPDLPDKSLDNEEEVQSAVDEEVSEIIDEVMEIADEMTQDGQETVPEQALDPGIAESLLDELEQVDIELPEVVPLEEAQAAQPQPETEEVESEAGSLEDEWAKLLEEDAASKEKSTDK